MAASGIASDVLERIRGQVDLVRVIEDSGVSLRPRGKNLVGKCPFHQDDTPSFSVSPQKQLYHCFGCGASGTVFTYVSQRERVPFEEAVEQLAARAGITLGDRNSTVSDLVQKVRAATRFAHEHFHEWLLSPSKGAKAQAYLDKRGVTPATIRDLGLGYVPSGWDNLMSVMKRAGFDSALLIKAGLVRQNDRGNQYDYFRDRVIFPIRDVRGEVVAFGGRAMDDSDPKYLNSPDTPIYKKSDLLYFLDVARADAQDQGHIFVTEGYLDAIALYQVGVKNVVASLGTALSETHARLLKRYTGEVIFLFDGDEAGARAVERGAPHFLREGIRTKVVVLPAGSDPDDYLRDHTVEEFQALAGNAVPILQYHIERLGRDLESSSSDQKVEALRGLADLIRVVPSRIYREEYAERIAADLGLAPNVVREELLRYGVTLNVATQQQQWADHSTTAGPRVVIERRLLAYLLASPELVPTVFEQMGPSEFSDPRHEQLARLLRPSGTNATSVDPSSLVESAPDDAVRDLIAGLFLETLPDSHAAEEVQACVDRIVADSLRQMELRRLAQSVTENVDDELAVARELAAMAKERRAARTRAHGVASGVE